MAACCRSSSLHLPSMALHTRLCTGLLSTRLLCKQAAVQMYNALWFVHAKRTDVLAAVSSEIQQSRGLRHVLASFDMADALGGDQIR